MRIPHLWFFVIYSCFSTNFCFSQEVGQKKIYVESTNFNARTIVRVTCIDFEQSFEGFIKAREIDDQDTIQILDFFLQRVKYSKKNDDVDTRAKLIYDRGNDTKVKICISKFDIVVDGRLIRKNLKFLAFLRKLVQ